MPEEGGKQKPRPQLTGDVLLHIEQEGSLQGFPASREEKVALMKAMTEQGLIVWNKMAGKYELTATAHKRLKG